VSGRFSPLTCLDGGFLSLQSGRVREKDPFAERVGPAAPPVPGGARGLDVAAALPQSISADSALREWNDFCNRSTRLCRLKQRSAPDQSPPPEEWHVLLSRTRKCIRARQKTSRANACE
jgi:hypothetical protein